MRPSTWSLAMSSPSKLDEGAAAGRLATAPRIKIPARALSPHKLYYSPKLTLAKTCSAISSAGQAQVAILRKLARLRVAMASSLRAKLFTHEDPLQIHKSLGLFCLVNFVYRFSHVGPTDMRFTSDWQTLAVLGLHAMLSLTSLIFQLPKKRIKGGYRIWPEYRLHSIAFALRSLVGMLVTWVELRRGAEPNYWINVGIVLGSMALADAGSKW
ncbi:hypothetical protein M885DRAFT_253115 [Pelagophyceae sp. CCMP2097]|nr:hypothetical protein M885DRAFT_253115 [Pelagophyceae sp. CCMP2097]